MNLEGETQATRMKSMTRTGLQNTGREVGTRQHCHLQNLTGLHCRGDWAISGYLVISTCVTPVVSEVVLDSQPGTGQGA